jgi:NAD(P)H-dependent FMN reductase
MTELLVLGLAGSPRRGGNSDVLLDEALAGASEAGAVIEKVYLEGLQIRPCQNCDGCLLTGVCIIDDDMQAIHHRLRKADRLVLAAPVFFLGIPAQAKSMVDRCQALWMEKYVLKKRNMFACDGSRRKGLWLSVGGRKGLGNFDGARLTVRGFFNTLDLEFSGELLYPQVDAYRSVLRHPTALGDAHQAGRALATSTPQSTT